MTVTSSQSEPEAQRKVAKRLASLVSAVTASLSLRLFLFLLASVFGLYAVSVLLSVRNQNRVTEELIQAEAYRASEFIKSSLTGAMMRNDREHIYESIQLLGRQPGMEAIRIYNKRGEIRFSSNEEEIDRQVDLEAEACYACHALGEPLRTLPSANRTRIYEKDRAYRVLGLINPIYNSPGCWSADCHVHSSGEPVLGVLDVQISMQDTDVALARSRRLSYSIAAVIVLLSALLVAAIVYRGIHRPAVELRRGTEALGRGELDVEIRLDRRDELGLLAAAFNEMARNLRGAYEELRAWSSTLEERVQRKTAELEQIHQQMILVEKAASLGKMAATVAHELNNPLTGILTYARLLERRIARDLPHGEERQAVLEELEMIRTESRRCGRIVRDLLTYARESAHELQTQHLHGLVEQALSLASHHMELGEIEARTELTLRDDTIVCDGEQIVQALLAMLINAVEAMPDGGVITVRTEPAPGLEHEAIRLAVSDTGSGIPEDIRDRIFDPFFSTKADAKGVGLGLAVVYGIVRRHEGTISVDSTVGKGTTFVIELPREPRAVATNHGTDSLVREWME